MSGIQGFRQSHAVTFVPHHLGPVKGSSPDIIPLMYLLVLINRSNSTPYAFGNNVIDKVYQVLVFYGINETSFEKPTKYRAKVYSEVRMPFLLCIR